MPTLTTPMAARRARHTPFPVLSDLHIVCLGSSAGGLPDLIQFFKSIYTASSLSFIVIQHLSTDLSGLTPAILSRITLMEAAPAHDDEPVTQNHVYTIPPNTQLTISAGRLHVVPRMEIAAHHHPFDHFLNSLAYDCRERATAVMLSGYDGDGAEGFITVKNHGGTTYAQDQPGLLNKIPNHGMATNCIDYMLSPMKIAEHIQQASQTKRLCT